MRRFFSLSLMCLALNSYAYAQQSDGDSQVNAPNSQSEQNQAMPAVAQPNNAQQPPQYVDYDTAKIQELQQQQLQNPQILKPGDPDIAYKTYQIGMYRAAMHYALKRAEIGDPAAQTLLAQIYSEGRAVAYDRDQSVYWYEQAAKNGDPYGKLFYALYLLDDREISNDPDKALNYMREAAEAGIPVAQFYYGNLLMRNAPSGQGNDLALPWFLKGAGMGDTDSTFAASQILARGTPRVPRNDEAARRFMEIAAEDGHSMAQLNLADWMLSGRGGEQNLTGGFHWMRIAAINENELAQIRLARLYRDGIGIEGNVVKASAWYLIAQNNGRRQPDLDGMLEGLNEEQLRAAFALAPRLFDTAP